MPAVSSLVAAVVNVAANLAVIPHWGGTGAAAVTTASYAAEAVVALHLLRRSVGRLRLVSIAPEAIAVGAVLGVALWLVPAPLLLEVPVGFVLYVVGWALLARRRVPEQVDLLAGLLTRRAAA